MTSTEAQGRIVGAVYLVVVLTGLFSLMYVPSHIPSIAAGLPLARLADSLSLQRWGAAMFVFEQIAFVMLPLLFYRLLKTAGTELAALMVGLA